MADIVDIFVNTPPQRGEAICTKCEHTWQCVAPISVRTFDCPECGAAAGCMRNVFEPPVGSDVFTCNCGNDLFWMLTEGLFCRNCGVIHTHFL